MNFYKQYLEVKKQYPDALVFYRVENFYELFGTDAVTASEALSLTLTGRDCGLADPNFGALSDAPIFLPRMREICLILTTDQII